MQQLFISRPVSTSFYWGEGGRWWWKRYYTSIAVFFFCTVRMQYWVCPPFLHSQAIPLLYEVLEFDPRFFVSDDLAFVGVFSASYLVNTFACLKCYIEDSNSCLLYATFTQVGYLRHRERCPTQFLGVVRFLHLRISSTSKLMHLDTLC
ncbi:hypothetical protein AKJ16_DCAP14753 [Drosera capensis]